MAPFTYAGSSEPTVGVIDPQSGLPSVTDDPSLSILEEMLAVDEQRSAAGQVTVENHL